VAAWIAIYRYRLFDARRVLSQALVYAGLSACVLAVYFAVAAAAGAVVRHALSQPAALVVAIAAALPVYGMLRRWATRLVYRDRDDPYAALMLLGRRLEDAAEPDDVLPEVARTIRQALRLDFVGIQVGETTARDGFNHGEGERFPLVFAGETIGTLTISRPAGRPPGPDERRLLDGIIRQVAAAGHTVALTVDSRRSREQRVTATAEERRRLRRDLHDGLGPGLAGVALGVHRARRQVPSDPAAAVAQLDALTGQMQDAIAEVRRLVEGLRPAALDELGLVAALTERAETFGAIAVSGPMPAPELPAGGCGIPHRGRGHDQHQPACRRRRCDRQVQRGRGPAVGDHRRRRQPARRVPGRGRDLLHARAGRQARRALHGGAPAPPWRPGPCHHSAGDPVTECPSEPARPIPVVFADDHPVFRTGLRTLVQESPLLEFAGQAAHGAEAVQVCAAAQPDVVLMDIRMPGVNGID
jgi:signal transduction histidine kinase